MKKIAISAEGDQVSAHFGHCEGFFEFTIEAGKPEGKQFVANPGHKPGFLPNFLHDRGVRVIIAGGMGSGAVEIFQEKGIDVYTGAQGSVDEIARQYADGTLTSTGSVCHEHQHEGSCGDHS